MLYFAYYHSLRKKSWKKSIYVWYLLFFWKRYFLCALSMNSHQQHHTSQSQKDVIYHYYYQKGVSCPLRWRSGITCPLDMVGKKCLPIVHKLLKFKYIFHWSIYLWIIVVLTYMHWKVQKIYKLTWTHQAFVIVWLEDNPLPLAGGPRPL